MPAIFAVAALAAFPVGQGSVKLQLTRGAELPSGALRYWSVEDTVLDSSAPDGNLGGSAYLECGSGKVLLIRFGDLRRAIGPNRRIVRASILFTLTAGEPAPLNRASELLVPWGEGPAQVITYTVAPPTLTAPAWSSSWRHRRSGESPIAWQQPGASGASDSRAIGAAKMLVPDRDHVRIEGLEAVLQRQYERPYSNFGVSFAFDGKVEFASSQARSDRPVLELEVAAERPAAGADLAVVRIARTPEYPKLQAPRDRHRAEQDGVVVEVPGEPSNLAEKHAPDEREEVTYTATIKNLGDAPATGFVLRWVQRERPGSSIEMDRTLAPGDEATVQIRSPYRHVATDHRVLPLGLICEPKGPDADPSNNGLTIQENALSFGFRIPASLASKVAASSPLGTRNIEGFAQALIGLWNEVLFPQSRFSFAPDGALERLRLQRLEIVPTTDAEIRILEDPNLDGSISVPADLPLEDPAALRKLLKAIGRELGLADLEPMNLRGGPGAKPIVIGGNRLARACADLFPGIMGGGDTRFDGYLPNALTPPYEPIASPIFDALPMEGTDLLAATDVAAINAALSRRRGFWPDALYRQAGSVILRIVDFAGLPVGNAPVEIYPMAGGQISRAEPIAKLQTSALGTVALPSRPSQMPEGFKSLTLPPLSSPFGRIAADGSNGVLLVRVGTGSGAGFAFIKAWQLADSYRRNPSPALVHEVRVNAGGEVDAGQNLAKNRIVSDSANSLPAKLSVLADESNSTGVELSGAKDAWVEIDLGRDRAFGEIQLVASKPFWEKFTLMAYSTGQTTNEAKVVAKEVAWSWTAANRAESVTSEGALTVAYRTAGLRARYLRLVRTENGPPGQLSEIRVLPLRAP